MTKIQDSSNEFIDGYKYADTELNCSHDYLIPALDKVLSYYHRDKSLELFDLGCGNGSIMRHLDNRGYSSRGVDPSAHGIKQAEALLGKDRARLGSAYDDLRKEFGQFDTVISLEVVEHVYAPREYASTVADLLIPGGHAIVSTPYHSYWKNLAMAVTGKMDEHFTALWDHGHIKFWSVSTLTQLMSEFGLKHTETLRVGRVPPLAKSMMLIFEKLDS